MKEKKPLSPVAERMRRMMKGEVPKCSNCVHIPKFGVVSYREDWCAKHHKYPSERHMDCGNMRECEEHEFKIRSC